MGYRKRQDIFLPEWQMSCASDSIHIRNGCLGSLISFVSLLSLTKSERYSTYCWATSLSPSLSQTAMAHMWKAAWAKTNPHQHHHHHHHTFKTSHTHQHHSLFPPTDPLAPPPTPEISSDISTSAHKRRSLFKPLSLTPRSSINITSTELGIEMANMPTSSERTPDERGQFPWIPTSPRRSWEEESLRSELSRRSTEL
jgi:hypothetical protein